MSQGENFTVFPKYTTFLDAGTSYTFYSDPWEVVPYSEITVEVFMAALPPTVSSVWADLQESNDLKEWTPIGGAASFQFTTTGTMATLTASNTARWVRLVFRDFSSSAVPAYYVLWSKGVARHA